MTKFSMCMQSSRSIDNQLAKLRRGVDTPLPPPPAPEREVVEKYHLRERVNKTIVNTSIYEKQIETIKNIHVPNVGSFLFYESILKFESVIYKLLCIPLPPRPPIHPPPPPFQLSGGLVIFWSPVLFDQRNKMASF